MSLLTTSKMRKIPTLSVLSSDLLVIPASSTPVVHVFSTDGQTSSGKRNRLTDANLERERKAKVTFNYNICEFVNAAM